VNGLLRGPTRNRLKGFRPYVHQKINKSTDERHKTATEAGKGLKR